MRPLAAAALALLLTLPASAQDDDVVLLIQAGRVITVSGEEFSPGMVMIRNGRVEAVGARIEIPPGAELIDAPESTLMPGLVNARSRFALRSYRRDGNSANLSADGELFMRAGDLEPALESGFVALGLIPAGSGVPGNAVAVRPLDGSREEILLEGAGYLRIVMTSLPSDKRTLSGALKAANAAIAREEKARAAFEAKVKKAEAAAKKAEAAKKAKPGPKGPPAPKGPTKPAPKGAPGKKAPAKKAPTFTPPPVPPSVVPFVELIRKSEAAPRVMVEINRAAELLHYADAVKDSPLEPSYYLGRVRGRFSLSDASDLYHAVEGLSKEQATVLLHPVLLNEPYTKTRRNLPAEFNAAGARMGLVPDSDDADGFRKLLSSCAELVREGLPRAAALRALTLVPAEVLGLGAELGTIEKGRRADLILLSADPFQSGAQVTRVLIAGETVWSKEERP